MSADQKSAAPPTRRTKPGTAGTPKVAPPKSPGSRAAKSDATEKGSGQSDAAKPSATQTAEQTTTERAEEVFDQIGQRIGTFMLVARDQAVRLGARAREEAEDIWAEAQHLRGRK